MKKSEINKIKILMMQSLEEVDQKGIIQGEFVCHEDIPDSTPHGFDAHFTVCGDESNYKKPVVYLVLIKKIQL